jgi:hypothetical protein
MSNKNKRQRTAITAGNKPFEFKPDYSQVKRDLTRIGILAGTFVVILVVLSFFQDQILALFIK